jgi:16S rRNA (adenine1518-N6/adenine1519-N6)-dimethyltransferase
LKHLPRKRFGQHFLTDSSVLSAIVAAINPQPQDRVLEIGPGLGALTDFLLARLTHLDAVEIDRDLVQRLRQRWPETRLSVHEADALAFDWSALGTVRLVGNLPYNISTPLLIRLIDVGPGLIDAHFMLQKEVVQRIVASHGCAAYGRLSVMMQAFYDVQALFDVPPEAFDPPPRVDSAVVRLRPRAQADVRDRGCLERLLAQAFNQRRKMLRGTLWPWLRQQGVDPEWVPVSWAPTARPEDVSVADWICLANVLAAR